MQRARGTWGRPLRWLFWIFLQTAQRWISILNDLITSTIDPFKEADCWHVTPHHLVFKSTQGKTGCLFFYRLLRAGMAAKWSHLKPAACSRHRGLLRCQLARRGGGKNRWTRHTGSQSRFSTHKLMELDEWELTAALMKSVIDPRLLWTMWRLRFLFVGRAKQAAIHSIITTIKREAIKKGSKAANMTIDERTGAIAAVRATTRPLCSKFKWAVSPDGIVERTLVRVTSLVTVAGVAGLNQNRLDGAHSWCCPNQIVVETAKQQPRWGRVYFLPLLQMLRYGDTKPVWPIKSTSYCCAAATLH